MNNLKYVVVSEKKGSGGGSRVLCGGMSLDEATATMARLADHPNTKHRGPFRIVTIEEAEAKHLYGD